MFAQTCIIPSRPATNKYDIRPHLVSGRETLVLFKPIDKTFDFDTGVEIFVSDKEGNMVFEKSMSSPDQLPVIAERISTMEDIFNFLEPDSYGKEVNGLQEFEDINRILTEHDIVKVTVSDDGFAEKFILPEVEKPLDTLMLVTFSSVSMKPFFVQYSGKEMKIKANGKMSFLRLNGFWENMFESAYMNDVAIRNFIMNNKKLTTVDQKNKIKKLRFHDDNGMTELIQKYGNIKIAKGDYMLPQEVKFPPYNEEFNGKWVVFTSISNDETTVLYGTDVKNEAISTKDNILIFMNRDGIWMEWSDVLFGSIYYGENFWSAKIPRDYVIPGMSLLFKNGEVVGTVLDIEVGAPTELVLHTIDIGMLVEPRDEFDFQHDKDCQAEYFQRIPVSRLIVTQYEPIYLKEVVLYDGTTYIDQSADTGDALNGDMREQIAKGLISTGINMANYGIHSTDGPSKAKHASPYIKTANWFTINNSRGKYSNGVKVHGLAGGGTVVTIIKTCRANEFAHELGHNWNGHYPNGFNGSVHRSSEYFGSTWGWNSDYNKFLPNFRKSVTGKDACYCNDNEYCECQESFLGHEFGKDAMAGGGGPMYPSIMDFTMHTPYMLYRIQNGEGTGNQGKGKGLELGANWDKNSETGLVKWDAECKCMKPWSVTPLDDFSDLPRKPIEQGVPVATLVGFYDPQSTLKTYIYPALHGAYGNVFEESTEEEINNISENGCYVTVRNANDEEKKFALKDYRQDADGYYMNKFHINVAENFDPTTVMIHCKNQKVDERTIEKPAGLLSYNVIGRPF